MRVIAFAVIALAIAAALFIAGYLLGRAVVHWPPVWRVIATWPYAVDCPAG